MSKAQTSTERTADRMNAHTAGQIFGDGAKYNRIGAEPSFGKMNVSSYREIGSPLMRISLLRAVSSAVCGFSNARGTRSSGTNVTPARMPKTAAAAGIRIFSGIFRNTFRAFLRTSLPAFFRTAPAAARRSFAPVPLLLLFLLIFSEFLSILICHSAVDTV